MTIICGMRLFWICEPAAAQFHQCIVTNRCLLWQTFRIVSVSLCYRIMMKTHTAAVTCEDIFHLNLRLVLQRPQCYPSHHVFGCIFFFYTAASFCMQVRYPPIAHSFCPGNKNVSGRHGLKVSQKPLIILVKLSHQNNFSRIRSRAMWFDWCQYNVGAVSSFGYGAIFVLPDTGPFHISQSYNLRGTYGGLNNGKQLLLPVETAKCVETFKFWQFRESSEASL